MENILGVFERDLQARSQVKLKIWSLDTEAQFEISYFERLNLVNPTQDLQPLCLLPGSIVPPS